MAARKRKITLTESWKEKIKVSMILNRLQDHVLSDSEMSATQIKAADILMRKVVPDLKSVELSSDPDKPLRGVLNWGAPE